MKATSYIQLVRLRKELKNSGIEMLQAKVWLVITVLITLLSPFTGEWECTVASLLMVVLVLGAKALIQGQVDRAEERIFQHRLKHSTYNI